jgi:hypothetical protein
MNFKPKGAKMKKKRMANFRKDASFKEIEKILDKREPEYDADGRTVINMTVNDDSSFLSAYSERATTVISSEVADFIESATIATPPSAPLTLRIHSDRITAEEKAEYTAAIREYYAQKYAVTRKTYRFNVIALLTLVISGIITLILAFNVESHIWSEVIDIVAWVLIWEAVDIGVFRNRESNILRKRYISYMTMKVEFLPKRSN